jgi:glycosyltransferase involved in cell wall biosynthesis
MKLSLHMMVLNAAATIDRALRPLAGIVDEVVFTDTGSADGTPDKIISLAKELGMKCSFFLLSSNECSKLYFTDEPGAFKFKFPSHVAFTGLPQIRDWAWARNLSLDFAQGEYVLRIDADDEVMRPENILPALAMLDCRPKVDFLMCPYEVMDGNEVDYMTSHHFFWRNKLEHRFKYVLHEHVPGRKVDGSNWLVVQRGLVFRDWRDNAGSGVRVPHRNFKVLLLEYERCLAAGEPVDPHVRLTLADEGIEVDPEFSLSLLPEEREVDYPQALGWFYYIKGECCRRLGRLEDALNYFELSGSHDDLRGLLKFGFALDEMGFSHTLFDPSLYRAVLREVLERRQVAASCLIRRADVLKAQQMLGELASHRRENDEKRHRF